MIRVNHLSNGKSVMILGTVVGCLIILWPKVFYPMMQGSFQTTNQDINSKARIHPRMMTSKVPKGFNGQYTSQRSESEIPLVDQSSIGGASVGLIMTIYTIGIIFLFFYTIFKYLSSDGSLNYIDKDDTFGNDQDYCDTDFRETIGETFGKDDHQQGECLKKLAINYIRCKSNLSEHDISPAISDYDDGVSMAYRTLLDDMLQLRDYLNELQCSVNGCDEPCDEFCNCSDEIIDYRKESDPHDIDFDVGVAISQMFGSDQEDEKDTDNEEEKLTENEDEPEKESANSVPDDLIASRLEDGSNRLTKTKVYQRKNIKSNNLI